MEMEGIEPSALTPSKSHISPHGGTESGTLDDKNDPELARLTAIWPTLPKQVKSKLTDLIDKHTAEGQVDGDDKEKG